MLGLVSGVLNSDMVDVYNCSEIRSTEAQVKSSKPGGDHIYVFMHIASCSTSLRLILFVLINGDRRVRFVGEPSNNAILR